MNRVETKIFIRHTHTQHGMVMTQRTKVVKTFKKHDIAIKLCVNNVMYERVHYYYMCLTLSHSLTVSVRLCAIISIKIARWRNRINWVGCEKWWFRLYYVTTLSILAKFCPRIAICHFLFCACGNHLRLSLSLCLCRFVKFSFVFFFILLAKRAQ